MLDTRTGQWRELAPAPVALAEAAAAEVGGTIYLVGGRGEAGATTAAYAYTPASDSWRELAPPPTARYGLSAVTFNGKIYALGGLVDGAASTVVEIFDLATGAWSAGLPMLGPMADFGAVVYSGRIHAIADSVQQVFDPRANKWVTDSPLPTPRLGQGVAVLGDTVYAVGGRAEGAPTSVALVEGYLPGEAPTPDNFQLIGFNRGGSIAVVVGIVVTIGLMALMLRLGRRRPTRSMRSRCRPRKNNQTGATDCRPLCVAQLLPSGGSTTSTSQFWLSQRPTISAPSDQERSRRTPSRI